jgi:hypothetical protein
LKEQLRATVLFWLAILMRYQWVSRLSGIVLAGLSVRAFAFTENILYYGRVYRYAARTFGECLRWRRCRTCSCLRGLVTFFGHPLFTAMTGIGLAIALRSKAKSCAVVAPLAGYGVAGVLAHGVQRHGKPDAGRQPALHLSCRCAALVLGMIIFVVRQLYREGRLIRERLTDYVRLGWLPESDPQAMSRLRTRLRALWHAFFEGPTHFSPRFECSGPSLSWPICAMP